MLISFNVHLFLFPWHLPAPLTHLRHQDTFITYVYDVSFFNLGIMHFTPEVGLSGGGRSAGGVATSG